MRRAPTLDPDALLADILAGPPPEPATTALLDAASELLAEHGTRHWTVDDVADRAGVGRATVYRRFTSRDALMRAAITRDARRFFAAIADEVRAVESIEDKVVLGLAAGLRLARLSPLGSLLRSDPAAAISLLTSESLLRTATVALTERYEALSGARLAGPARQQVEVSAEALIRLGISFVLIPGTTADMDRLSAIIRPLVRPRT